MALSGTTIWEVETGGSDTLNGGAFDPGQTAGMLTDGAATLATSTAPVFTSASYNFVAGDAGAWIYIASGSNWIPGWYKIASVAANAATLNGTIAQAVLKALVPSTAAGCATTASPTGATWTIDYSQQSAAQFAYTDLASAGTGLTVSSVAKPFGKQQVGNALVITGGTNFNLGRYVVASVSVGLVATVVGPTNITTGVGATGTGGLGGALASLGLVGSVFLSSNAVFIKTGTYSVTSASTNIAAGCFSVSTTNNLIAGYGSVRGDLGTPPLLQASGAITTFQLVNLTGSGCVAMNFTCDGVSKTSSAGFRNVGGSGFVYKVAALNCSNVGLSSNSNTTIYVLCRATGCSSQAAIQIMNGFACESYSNTISGFTGGAFGTLKHCLAYNNTGASSDGFAIGGTGECVNCVAYANGRDGFRAIGSSGYTNCIAEANSATGFNNNSQLARFLDCATFNNTSGNTFGTTYADVIFGLITGVSSFFVNAASGNFALNNTTGAGAAARAAGIPGGFLSGTTTSFLDVGAAQHQDSGSSGMLFVPNLEGT